jgi:hypothetical protein
MTYVELFVDQGTDYQTNMDLKRDDGTPMSVAGYSFTGQIRKSYYSTNPTANLVITATDAPNGNLSLTMNSSVTTNIAPGRYVYDVKMMDTSNVTIRIMEGIITVTPQVSR